PRASASLAVSVAPAIHPPPRSPLFPYTTLFRSLVQFGAFVQVGDGIEGLVHISEMSAHHVDAPEQVVTPGEELWVKIIDLDLQRRRINLSFKQAADSVELAAEIRMIIEIGELGQCSSRHV